ncbi:hypothetical protein JCGZ_14768 [Jatropha curcas]|uniref:Aminotransferase-like plant mobile domain-containing protein n=1 Tax=Jatropha curcas TaxID=180498 RepID=A0A067KC96_JATCU|nr:hypothetical protein JCGZ_14768 [Jatropha curcas]
MVFRFEDSEVTPTYEEMCAVMGHHPEQDETPSLPPGPRISRQYGMIQRVPRMHDFESGLMTPSSLTHIADRWRSRNTRYLGQVVMQDTVTPEYVNWFYTP